MNSIVARRPRLALPFTVLPGKDTVRLIAGEDFRYTLSGPAIERWAPPLLAQLAGRRPLDELLRACAAPRADAIALIERLYGERVLVDGTAEDAHLPEAYTPLVHGTGAVAAALRATPAQPARRSLPVLCQDSLDFDSALRFGRERRLADEAWLWVSGGAMTRGWVSPVFLPDAGACLACLLDAFAQRSPLPELYAELIAHARDGGLVDAVPFPAPGLRILAALTEWKVAQLAQAAPVAGTYRLHVLETATMEVATHRVFPNPHCRACASGA